MSVAKMPCASATPMPAVLRVEERQVERVLQGMEGGICRASSGRSQEAPWLRLVLEASCYCLKELCACPSLPIDEYRIEQTVVRWWSNRHYQFHSAEHYLHVRYQVIDSLRKLLLTDPLSRRAIVCFQQITEYVDELDMELSQHIHMIVNAGMTANDGYIVRKFVVSEPAGTLELYHHMTAVLCKSVFGRLPAAVQTYSLLDGSFTTWRPEEQTWLRSVDYMRLVAGLLPCHPDMDSAAASLRH